MVVGGGGGGGGGFERLGEGEARDRALIQWQSEDQSWLRNWAAKQPERIKGERKDEKTINTSK